MSLFRAITPAYSVAAQLQPDDMARAAAAGFVLVINNRPDGEAPGQPSAATMAAAARTAGIDYLHLPIIGMPTPAQAAAQRRAREAARGPVLAFCRSGTRSAVAWALGAEEPRAARVALAARAGYDLSAVLA